LQHGILSSKTHSNVLILRGLTHAPRTGRGVRGVNNPLLTAVHAGRKPEMTAML
jgi:hypothetical protein